MCAIIDASIVHQVFGSDRTDAGTAFFTWIASGNGRLVAGGKLLKELSRSEAFRSWWSQAQLAGRTTTFQEETVDRQTQEVEREGVHRSNDPHVLALAQISGARLLFTNDLDLQKDFKNSELIEPSGGRIYTTIRSATFGKAHKNLLRRGAPCPR